MHLAKEKSLLVIGFSHLRKGLVSIIWVFCLWSSLRVYALCICKIHASHTTSCVWGFCFHKCYITRTTNFLGICFALRMPKENFLLLGPRSPYKFARYIYHWQRRHILDKRKMKFQNVVQTTCLRSVQSNKLSNYHLPQTNEKGENLFFSHIIFQSENIFQLHLLKKITQLNKKTGLGNLNKKSFTLPS